MECFSVNINNISFYWNRIHIFKVNIEVNAEAHSQTTAVYYRHSHQRQTQHPPANTLFSKAVMICSLLLQISLFGARITGITHHVDSVTSLFYLAQCSQLSKLQQVSGLNPLCGPSYSCTTFSKSTCVLMSFWIIFSFWLWASILFFFFLGNYK